MKININKEKLEKIKNLALEHIKTAARWSRREYLKNKPRHRAALAVLAVCLCAASMKIFTHNSANYPVHFDTNPMLMKKLPVLMPASTVNTAMTAVWREQLEELKAASEQQYQAVHEQLQDIRSNMAVLASQDDVQQLQQTVADPDSALLGKVDHLQDSVQKILKQSKGKQWVNASVVERYFRLVAVQGFSDGMRAIIDVDGNEAALSKNEICPACHGWTLRRMDFSEQTAVFFKKINSSDYFVKLTAD